MIPWSRPASLARFAFLSFVKTVGYLTYPSRLDWVSKKPSSWHDISLIVILNHTSLFEFIHGINVPYSFLAVLADKLTVPVAAETVKARKMRFIFSMLAAKIIPISRRRDSSWKTFLAKVESTDVCIFFPEGRMKRPSGLDKHGRKMTVRTGVCDVLEKYRGRKMVIVYSHGLHHVMAPGQQFPRLFRKISAKSEYFEVSKYLSQFQDSLDQASAICKDLEQRRDLYCH